MLFTFLTFLFYNFLLMAYDLWIMASWLRQKNQRAKK